VKRPLGYCQAIFDFLQLDAFSALFQKIDSKIHQSYRNHRKKPNKTFNKLIFLNLHCLGVTECVNFKGSQRQRKKHAPNALKLRRNNSSLLRDKLFHTLICKI